MSADTMYSIECFNKMRTGNPKPQTHVRLSMLDGEHSRKTLFETKSYQLIVENKINNPTERFFVRNCFAFSSAGDFLELIDGFGCTASNFSSNLLYEVGKVSATLDSLFHLKNSNKTFIQCSLDIYYETFYQPQCPQESLISELHPDDSLLVSSSFFIAPASSLGSARSVMCSLSDSNPNWLTYLCATFGVLFSILVILNIFLCSSFESRCKKKIILEDEPHLYDDYSVQYCYSNSDLVSQDTCSTSGKGKSRKNLQRL